MSESSQTAKIVEWNDPKGFGFLQVGKRRVFLHRGDFTERHKRPAVGDVIRFTMGKDAQGRTCAQNAAHVNDGGRITPLALTALAGLLVLPVIALNRLGANFLWVGSYALLLGVTSYAAYAEDKRSARQGKWRINESILHLTELLGGWPGAFLAQRRLRHKVSKPGFQFVFWTIVLGYQLVACDSLQNWKLSRAAWTRISQHGTEALAASKRPVIEIITNTLPPSTRRQ
jgi:uncharacterized membrane protein YsdA (DUF1294 family)/cold shock CspA family protein